jgi:L-threonylcarbamoyladenylate synthase
MKPYFEDVKKSLTTLKEKGIILYPTDTVWGIGCDATCVEAVKKIFSIKERSTSKNMILLIDHESKLNSYVRDIPEQAWTLIEYSEKPLTIIYDGAKNLPPEVIAEDGSIAIRVTKDEFCCNLISALRKPLISTSANLSGDETPSSFNQINPKIIESADYVVNWRQTENIVAHPSTIIRLRSGGQIEFIRR